MPGQRVFDIAINGTTVAKDLDIFARAGGKDRALVETFVVDAPEGTIRLSVPRVTSDNATLAAVELRDSSGKVVRAVFRDKPYTDPAGNVWTPIAQQADDYWKPDLRAAIERARRDGTRVVLLTTGGGGRRANRCLSGRAGTGHLFRTRWRVRTVLDGILVLRAQALRCSPGCRRTACWTGPTRLPAATA